jgi:microcystin-dependent protein
VKKKKIRILVIVSVALLILGGVVTSGILASGDQPEGKPFQALWEAVDDLHDRIDNEGGVPVGAIMMWSGTIDTNGNPVVSGTSDTNWHICDGTSGTPDLQDRFIVGSGSNYAIGAAGGAATVTLDISQMPSHRHHYSGTTSTAGAHTHTYSDIHIPVGDSSSMTSGSHDCANDHWVTDHRTTSSAGDHSHTFSGDTDSQGDDAAHENRPPYYALAYIMKVQ